MSRAKLEAFNLHPLFIDIFCGDITRPHEVAVSQWRADGEPIFAPGHEPVSKEGRELLGRLAEANDELLAVSYNIRRDFSNIADAVFRYRDSLTPAVVVPDGWEEVPSGYKRHGFHIAPLADGYQAHAVIHGGNWVLDSDALLEAFAAAESMIERLGLVAPDTATEADPEGWHKTDGMAPPKEAGERVIETVDGYGNLVVEPAPCFQHSWGRPDAGYRPIKWRYADGG